mmetsp:Transcript_91663/g.290834  ORF Transcript_91663/g.290834 Transcript_91663/m.290834 type:complete len:262 (+) Transcript_91663:895-1680(+)
MAAQELRGAVQHDVGPKLERPAEVRGRRGVVADERQPVLARNGRHLLQVDDHAAGVADGLAVDRLRLLVDAPLHALVVVLGDEADLPAELRKLPRELRDGAAVELVRGDEVVPAVHEVGEAEQLGGVPAGDAQGIAPALQGSYLGLQRVARGVAEAGVDRAKCPEAELRRSVLGVLEDEAGVLHDGLHAGTGGRVRLLPRVEAHRGEIVLGVGRGGQAAPELLGAAHSEEPRGGLGRAGRRTGASLWPAPVPAPASGSQGA